MSEDTVVVHDRRFGGQPDEPDKAAVESVLHSSLRVLRRRRMIAAAVLVGFVVPAGIFVMRRPPIYQATARILIERSDELTSVLKDPAGGGPPIDNFFQTQIQLLRGRPIVVKAIQEIRLWESAEFARPLNASSTAEAVSRSGVIDQFLLHLTVTPVPDTHLLNVTFRASDPAARCWKQEPPWQPLGSFTPSRLQYGPGGAQAGGPGGGVPGADLAKAKPGSTLARCQRGETDKNSLACAPQELASVHVARQIFGHDPGCLL